MGMLRIVVGEDGQPALPAIDVTARVVTIGSGPEAQVRLPAQVAAPAHVTIEDGRWRALAPVSVDGRACAAGDTGAIAAGVSLAIGAYRLAIGAAPPGTAASPPQRTESLARELVRGLLGGGAGPTFTVTAGPAAGVTRPLPPPDAVVVIGRGDEATWVILDEDLSRSHAEVRRGWDGVTVVDLGSKNGTRVAGGRIRGATPLHDGDVIELGHTRLRFDDPADRHLRATAPEAPAPMPAVTSAEPCAGPPDEPAAESRLVLGVAVAIAVVAALALVWILAA